MPFGHAFVASEKAEIDVVRPDGKQIVAEIRKVCTELLCEPVEIISVRDVTQRKRIEEDRFLMKKFEAISILSGGISHDFNNLLTTIIGFIQLSMNETDPGGMLNDNLAEALSAATEAKNIMLRFLQFTRKMVPKLLPTPIELPLQRAIASVNDAFENCVSMKIPKDLSRVMADELLISKAFANLLQNAFEATQPGGIVRIHARNLIVDENQSTPMFTVAGGNYVKVSIQDEGSGIAKKNMPFIFDPYFTTKARGIVRGMGLGLSTAYNIIKSHKGYIFVESKEDEGTTVSIYLLAAMKEKNKS